MKIFQKFTTLEASGGHYLFLATALALLWSNSPFKAGYDLFVNASFVVNINHASSTIPLTFLINEGLMTLFFFLVGLEVKRELLVGELNRVKKAILPAIAAFGGMLIPAIIYVSLNWHSEVNLRGWAIPTATDIAFSLAVLSLLKHRIPTSLKIFLTALAIFDDLGAILIIAIFYTEKIQWLALTLAGFLQVVLILLNVFEIVLPILYGLLGISIWWLLLMTGIHPTLAGVLVALTVPLKVRKRPYTFREWVLVFFHPMLRRNFNVLQSEKLDVGKTTPALCLNQNIEISGNLGKKIPKTHSRKVYLRPLNDLERKLHPWVTFLLLPMFAFVNAGISLESFFDSLFSPVSLGIVLGLFLGKQLGVFGFCWLAVKNKLAQLPTGMHWKNLYGISLLGGIGFTMSFFIGFLSFEHSSFQHQNYLRSGILLGSLLSAVCGYWWLSFVHPLSKSVKS